MDGATARMASAIARGAAWIEDVSKGSVENRSRVDDSRRSVWSLQRDKGHLATLHVSDVTVGTPVSVPEAANTAGILKIYETGRTLVPRFVLEKKT
eukprot:5875392-Pleurochrysis_carterae.AAC.2